MKKNSAKMGKVLLFIFFYANFPFVRCETNKKQNEQKSTTKTPLKSWQTV